MGGSLLTGADCAQHCVRFRHWDVALTMWTYRLAWGLPGGEVLVTVGMELIVPKGDDGKARVITLRVYLIFTSFENVVPAEWWCSGRGHLGR